MSMEVDHSLTPDSAPELRALYDDYRPWADRSEKEVARLIENTDEVIGSIESLDGGVIGR